MTLAPKSFRKLFTEFAVIVVGVLVALTAESWWSDREQRQYERELREDMAEEFRENIQILEDDIAFNQVAIESFDKLALMDEQTLLALPDDMMNQAYRVIPEWQGFDPHMGSVQALVESGNISAISDRDLRILLARWAGLLEEKRRFNLQAVTFQLQTVAPAIAAAAADEVWTAMERREVQALYKSLRVLQSYVTENQLRLRETARQIRDHLAAEVG